MKTTQTNEQQQNKSMNNNIGKNKLMHTTKLTNEQQHNKLMNNNIN